MADKMNQNIHVNIANLRRENFSVNKFQDKGSMWRCVRLNLRNLCRFSMGNFPIIAQTAACKCDAFVSVCASLSLSLVESVCLCVCVCVHAFVALAALQDQDAHRSLFSTSGWSESPIQSYPGCSLDD